MQTRLLWLFLYSCSVPTWAQNSLRLTNLITHKTVDIKRQQFIQCRYHSYQTYQFLAGGVVREVTDSTLIYSTTSFSAKKSIPLSAITHLDKVPVKRSLVPAVVLGIIVGISDHYINPQRSQVTSGLLGTGAIIVGLNYVFKWDRRHLNKNIIGETTSLQVVPRRM